MRVTIGVLLDENYANNYNLALVFKANETKNSVITIQEFRSEKKGGAHIDALNWIKNTYNRPLEQFLSPYGSKMLGVVLNK